MEVACIISEAKCCSVDFAEKFVCALNVGEDTEKMRYDFYRLNAYIRTLQRYECKPKDTYTVADAYVAENNILVDGNKILILNAEKVEKDSSIEKTNCTTESDIKIIIEQLKLMCGKCNCNC